MLWKWSLRLFDHSIPNDRLVYYSSWWCNNGDIFTLDEHYVLYSRGYAQCKTRLQALKQPRYSYSIYSVIIMWNHSSSLGPMFVGKQIFAGSWGRYFVGKLCDVTLKMTLTWFIYKVRKDLLWCFIMLQNRVYFPINTSMRPVIAGKWNHLRGFRARWIVKTMITIEKNTLWLMLN